MGHTDNDGNGSNSGHVRIYNYNGSAWVQVGADIDGEAVSDYSGNSVSLSSDGSRVAIGATGNDGVSGSNSGHVRIYNYNGSAWVQVGADIDGEATSDLSGWSVSLSSDGSRVAIGATLMMEMDLTPVMSVFTITMDRLGCKLEQILMGKR